MKRVATALLATAPLLLPATPALAQTTFALTGGMNLASIAVTEGGRDLVNRSAARASIGLAAGIPISERLGLHLGGSYSQKGASVRQTGRTRSYDARMGIDYIELSALGKAQVHGSGEGVQVHLLAGPAVAMKTACEWRSTTTLERTTGASRWDCQETTASSFDFGMTGGVWMEMWVSDNFGMLLSGLYTRGLKDIYETSADDTMKNRIWSFRTGIIYSIG